MSGKAQAGRIVSAYHDGPSRMRLQGTIDSGEWKSLVPGMSVLYLSSGVPVYVDKARESPMWTGYADISNAPEQSGVWLNKADIVKLPKGAKFNDDGTVTLADGRIAIIKGNEVMVPVVTRSDGKGGSEFYSGVAETKPVMVTADERVKREDKAVGDAVSYVTGGVSDILTKAFIAYLAFEVAKSYLGRK